MTKPDAGVGGIPHIERQIASVPGEIEKLKEEVAKTSDPAAKTRVEANLRQAETYLEELKKMKPTPPTRGVTGGVTTLREGGREIQLHVVGRAHTDGDVFVYLTKEKVLVTGDAVVDWMPFIGDGFPEEWVQSLTTLEKLDFTHLIPGHGDVAPKTQLTFLKNYLADLVAAVKKAAADRATLDEMKSKIADQLAPKYEVGMSKYWTGRYRDRIGSNVEHVHKKVVKPA
jgi:glyoxylase-like metal-dependent hydrolase (beta-lactamase superfamily II)